MENMLSMRSTKVVAGFRLSLMGLTLSAAVISGSTVLAEYAGPAVKPSVQPQFVAYAPVVQLDGRLTISGSKTMAPILTRLAGSFMRIYPNVRIVVESEGSENVLVGFVDGVARARRGGGDQEGHLASSQIKLMASSRKLTQSELASFVSRYGYEPLELPIASDAVGIYVHKDSQLEGLTLGQVDAIFSKTRNRGFGAEIQTWGQIGVNHGASQAPIRLFGRDKDSGTREFFREHVLLGGDFKDSVEAVPGAASVIFEISRDRFAMGYSSVGFQTPLVKVVPLSEKEGSPFVLPSVETTSNNSYPLARSLYLYVNKPPDQPLDSLLFEFIRFSNSREGQEVMVAAGAYPIPARRASRNLALLGTAPSPLPIAMGKQSAASFP